MPRLKSEKSQLSQIHPPPAKNICFLRGPPHHITRQEEIPSDCEENDLPSEEAESSSCHGVPLLSNDSMPMEQPKPCFPKKIVCYESDAKPKRSLEALFQAADSELQNLETSATRTVVSPRLIVKESGSSPVIVQLPESVHLISNPHGRPSVTNVADSVEVKSLPIPFFRLNFSTDSKPRMLELQTRTDSGSSQEVSRVENASSLGGQINTGLVTSVSTELQQGTSFSHGQPGQHKLKHALKLGKCGLMYKPGKHVCVYCNRSCAKPSVLQKHLRTHTGERPYPCNDCGFHFKTKSNLYKHCKSRVHLTKMDPGGQVVVTLPSSEDCSSKTVDMETEAAKDLFGKSGTESEPVKEEKLQTLPQRTSTQKSNFGLKFPSCDSEIGRTGGAESDSQQILAARSLSVPESNEDRLSVALHSLLRLSDGSIYLMEKLCNGHAILRPVLQEVGLTTPNQTISLATSNQSLGVVIPNQSVALTSSNPLDVITGSQTIKTNGWMVSTNTAAIPFTGTKQTGSEQQIGVSETLQIQKEIYPLLSLPDRSTTLHSSHSKILQKSSSASVAVPATITLTSHRSHSLSSAHTVSIAPKMAPIDPKNVTPEAVQERIAMLISQNASIIDTPMADAPRPKRVLRHNSEATSASKTDASAVNLMKPLQRAKSLTPYINISPNLTRVNAEPTTAVSSTASIATKKRKAESLNSIDTSSRTTSNYLLVPSDPNLKGCGLPMKTGIRSQTSDLELLNLPPFPKPLLPVKAKSLDMTAKAEGSVGPVYPSKEFITSDLPIGKRIDETLAAQKMRILSEGANGSSSSMHVSAGSQDIHVVFHLPSSITPEMLNPVAVATNTTASEVRTVTKDVSEKRQEFARAHLMIENGSKTQSTNQMTKSTETSVENSLKIAPTLPLQYLVIPANPPSTQTFVPVVQSTLPTLVPQVAKSFDSVCQNPVVSVEVNESNVSLKRGRPKGAKNKQKASSVSSPSSTTTNLSSTFRSIPSICVTPAETVPPTESSESLWKLKLKGRLLMKRSLSIERTLSEEREGMPKTSSEADEGSSAAADTRLPSDSLAYQETTGLIRSCSYDAAMPLKKRRKTLTELGRGTAFGTRIEDGTETANAVSSAAVALSRASPLLVETGKRSPNPAGSRKACETTNSNDVAVAKFVGPCWQQEVEITKECVTLSCLSALRETPTNQGLERHCTSSLICSARGCQKLPDFLTIPLTVAQKVPGLLPEKANLHLLHPVENGTINQHLEVLEKLDNSKNPEAKNYKPVTAKHKLNLTGTATLGYSNKGQSSMENLTTASICASGVHSEFRSTEHENEAVVVQSGVASILLLLGHLYPSLNSSTNTTFCSVVKPQPMYLSQDANKKLSMYSTWQVAPAVSSCTVVPEVSISSMLAHRHMSITVSPHLYATSNISGAGVLTHSSYWNFKKVLEKKSKSQEGTSDVDVTYELPKEVDVQRSDAEEVIEVSSQKTLLSDTTSPPNNPVKTFLSKISAADVPTSIVVTKEMKRIQIFPGGYKSNEDYVYIRGRGKGKYVCEACGIRCKKPSMLKKHLRTHTDIRPHHCDVCSFGFKTKGNLSKHIKSKAHHSRCSDLGIAPVQRFSATSDETSFDSQVLISSGGENNESLDMNIASSSGDLHDDEDIDDLDNDDNKEDNDEDDDDGDSLDGDGDDSLMSTDVPESLMAPGKNTIPESVRSSYSFEGCSFGGKADIVRAATDSEAAASLLDLSKGDPTPKTRSNLSANNDSPSLTHPLALSQSLALFSRGFLQPSRSMHSQTEDQEKTGSEEERTGHKELSNEVIPLKTAGFIPPVLIITSCPSSSFQLPSSVFVAVSSASMTSSIPSADSHPWVLLKPSVLVQKNSDADKPSHVHDSHHQDEIPVVSTSPASSVLTTPAILPPVAPQVSPPFPSGESASATGSKTRATCEIVPVPGKVSGNTDECVDGKYVKFVCSVCTKSFSKAYQLAMHKNIHYMERPFRCSDCGISFQNRTLLDRHQRSEKHACKTDDPRPFKCDNCGVAFRIHGHLAKHLRSKVHIAKCEGLGKVPSEERDCEERESESVLPQPTDIVSGMENNVTFETGSNNSAVEVELSSDSAHESLRATESKEAPALMAAASVKSSAIAVPLEANVLAALRRNKSFSDVDRLNSEGSSSSQPEPHQCEICSKVFQDVALFEKHISSHVELRPYICDFCDAGFTNGRLLESHLNTHYQSKEHVCGVCGDMLSEKMSLHEQSKVHASPGIHCGQPTSETTTTLPTVTEISNRTVSANNLKMCPVQVLPEISVGNQLRVNNMKNCTGASQSADALGTGSLLKVIPSQNILTLANPNVLLMKSFNIGTSPESSANNINLGLGSINFSSSSLVRSAEALKSSTVSQPLGILLATPRSSLENSRVLSTSGLIPFQDVHQTSIRSDSAEAVCRFLAVSFQIGENVFSESTVRTDHEKSAFIASNFSEIIQNSAAVITTSASNIV